MTTTGIIAILLLAAPAYPQNGSQPPAAVTSKVKIQKIGIQGNHAFTASQIKGAMKRIKEGSSSNLQAGADTLTLKLQEDITRIRMFYAEHGYARFNIYNPIVEVKTVEAGRTLETHYFITIQIEENDQYRISNVIVTGNKQFSADEIRRGVGITSGKVYNETTLRKGFEKLKKMYARHGFTNLAPEPVFDFDETKKTVVLTIHIQEA